MRGFLANLRNEQSVTTRIEFMQAVIEHFFVQVLYRDMPKGHGYAIADNLRRFIEIAEEEPWPPSEAGVELAGFLKEDTPAIWSLTDIKEIIAKKYPELQKLLHQSHAPWVFSTLAQKMPK